MTKKQIATTVRCVPRYGYVNTQVREISVGVDDNFDEPMLYNAVVRFFHSHGYEEAVFDFDMDEDGYFAIVNDEVFEGDWGTILI
ncbi:MAG: hypothetical protein AB7N71_06085 [Phycisphaerae bacterium]